MALPKLDVVIANNFGHLPMFIGAEKGFFKQQGVDASFKVVDTGTDMVNALHRGEAQVGDMSTTTYLKAVHAGEPFKVIGLIMNDATRDNCDDPLAIVTKKGTGIEPGKVSIYYWLARIAKNKALDMHRAKKVSGRVLANFESLLEPLCTPNASPEELFEHEVSRHALGEAVQATLGELNERYRRAIELRFLQDLSRETCAEQLGVKLGTFDVLLLRALRAFRKSWEERMQRPSRELALP